MKPSKLFFFLLPALFLTPACRPSGSGPYDAVLDNLANVSRKDLLGYKAIFFVPSSGCGGCINGAENYLLNTYLARGRKGVLFIITGHSSAKSARVRLGPAALEHPDVYFDYHHRFDRPPFMREYPKVLMLEDGKVLSATDVNPESGDGVYHVLNQI